MGKIYIIDTGKDVFYRTTWKDTKREVSGIKGGVTFFGYDCIDRDGLLKKDVTGWKESDFKNLDEERKNLLKKLIGTNHPLCSKTLFSSMNDKKGENEKKDAGCNDSVKVQKNNERFFDKAYLNIVSSKEFRKLQDKTQIFPLAKSDYVRTRLTHSIEVSIVARQIAEMVYTKLEEKPDTSNTDLGKVFSEFHNDIENIVACAGLLHDLGNPPFGHFGEEAIGEWFKKHEDVYSAMVSPQQLTDLQKFEGNAQSLRILSKNYYRENEHLSVPISVASALVKYPNVSTSKEISNEDNSPVYRHKMGINQSEEAVFKKLSKIVLSKEDKGITRNPLAYIVEAADDIAYVTSDIQDSIAAGIISFDEVKELEPFADDPEMWGDLLRTKYKSAVCDVFIDNFEEISQGVFKHSLVKASAMNKGKVDDKFKEELKKKNLDKEEKKRRLDEEIEKNGIHYKLRNLMKEKVYEHDVLVEPELTAVTILDFLLDKYVPLCVEYAEEYEKAEEKEEFKLQGIKDKFLSRIPKDLKDDYKNWRQNTQNPSKEDIVYHGILIATDYISGMTDGEAKATYQLIKGID